jgi:hypothetical protein
LIEFARFLSDGVDQVLVDEEHELETGDLEHRVIAQASLGAATNLDWVKVS